MTPKNLAKKLFKQRTGMSVKKFGFNTVPWEKCIEEIARLMYEDLKDSDLDLDCKAMDVVLFKIGKKLSKGGG